MRFISNTCVVFVVLLIFPAIAFAEVYEIHMSQINPTGEAVVGKCEIDKKAPCVKTFKIPISINWKELKDVNVEVTLDVHKNLHAKFVLENRYPLSVTSAYYSPFEMLLKKEALKVQKVDLFALTDIKTSPNYSAWKGPAILAATVEIVVYRLQDK